MPQIPRPDFFKMKPFRELPNDGFNPAARRRQARHGAGVSGIWPVRPHGGLQVDTLADEFVFER
ncbi:hypothetical protein CKO27_23390 [Thiocystis violacea]|nr:hypothetical protein [Thiocystis violacea]